MTKLKGPLLSLGAQGTIGKNLTFAKVKGGTVAKSIPTHPDAQTLPQVYQRWRYYDAVQYWHSLTPAQQAAQETAGRPFNLTGFSYTLRQYLNSPIDQRLWLRLDPDEAPTTRDYSKQDNNGSITGAASVAARVSLGLSFDGVDDWVHLGGASAFDLRSTFTLTAWLYPRELPGGAWDYIMSKSGGASGGQYHFGYFSGQLRLLIEDATLGAESYSGASLVLNQWQHVAAVFDAPNSQATIYVDGVGVVNAVTKTPDAFPDRSLTLARRSTVYADSILDEIRIYSRALTPAHILYIATRELYPPPS